MTVIRDDNSSKSLECRNLALQDKPFSSKELPSQTFPAAFIPSLTHSVALKRGDYGV